MKESPFSYIFILFIYVIMSLNWAFGLDQVNASIEWIEISMFVSASRILIIESNRLKANDIDDGWKYMNDNTIELI